MRSEQSTFERFNEMARRALVFARYEAGEVGSATVETEHVLLGVLREGEAIVRDVLSRAGIGAEELPRVPSCDWGSVERVFFMEVLPLSEEAQRALGVAKCEAESLGHRAVGSEHLILGLLGVDGSAAHRALADMGLTLLAARQAVASRARDREEPERLRETGADAGS